MIRADSTGSLRAGKTIGIVAVVNLQVAYSTPSGANAYIPLGELATIQLDTGASYIYHESGERYIPIKFSLRGRDLGGTVADAQQRVAKSVKLPPGYRIIWAGEFEELEAAKKRLEFIVPISIVLLYEPVVKKDDMARNVVRETQLMRDNEHRHSLLAEPADRQQDFADQLRVQRRTPLSYGNVAHPPGEPLMQVSLIGLAREGVDPGVMPHIAAVPAKAAELDIPAKSVSVKGA